MRERRGLDLGDIVTVDDYKNALHEVRRYYRGNVVWFREEKLMTFTAIGERIGVSRMEAHRLYKEAKREYGL